MSGDMGTYVIFLLGILVGVIVGNKNFRYKFFKGLRGFLAQLGQGARSYNKKYNGSSERGSTRREIKEPPMPRPEVKHIYKREHTDRKCETCDGSGRVYEKLSVLQEGAPGIKPKIIDCPDCDGEGRVWD